MLKKVVLHSVATAFANNVFPVPVKEKKHEKRIPVISTIAFYLAVAIKSKTGLKSAECHN